ncbi:hypothetical protein OU995_23685 [Roseateles sp. SL47]|uniref:hypothetical protein n=1 Tax=Roseateles sp. SL47 TaxID=2995138 RepID=UPI00227030AE|nr:hypothetical protein [Roseateles sp. SL47]WAC72517.1 hypothetical protein OU995_23685 [Roseateles sp. SL47]
MIRLPVSSHSLDAPHQEAPESDLRAAPQSVPLPGQLPSTDIPQWMRHFERLSHGDSIDGATLADCVGQLVELSHTGSRAYGSMQALVAEKLSRAGSISLPRAPKSVHELRNMEAQLWQHVLSPQAQDTSRPIGMQYNLRYLGGALYKALQRQDVSTIPLVVHKPKCVDLALEKRYVLQLPLRLDAAAVRPGQVLAHSCERTVPSDPQSPSVISLVNEADGLSIHVHDTTSARPMAVARGGAEANAEALASRFMSASPLTLQKAVLQYNSGTSLARMLQLAPDLPTDLASIALVRCPGDEAPRLGVALSLDYSKLAASSDLDRLLPRDPQLERTLASARAWASHTEQGYQQVRSPYDTVDMKLYRPGLVRGCLVRLQLEDAHQAGTDRHAIHFTPPLATLMRMMTPREREIYRWCRGDLTWQRDDRLATMMAEEPHRDDFTVPPGTIINRHTGSPIGTMQLMARPGVAPGVELNLPSPQPPTSRFGHTLRLKGSPQPSAALPPVTAFHDLRPLARQARWLKDLIPAGSQDKNAASAALPSEGDSGSALKVPATTTAARRQRLAELFVDTPDAPSGTSTPGAQGTRAAQPLAADDSSIESGDYPTLVALPPGAADAPRSPTEAPSSLQTLRPSAAADTAETVQEPPTTVGSGEESAFAKGYHVEILKVVKDLETPYCWNTFASELPPRFLPDCSGWPVGRGLQVLNATNGNEISHEGTTVAGASPVTVVLNPVTRHYNSLLNQQLYEVAANGDCFFSAVLHAMGDSDRAALLNQANPTLPAEPTISSAVASLRSHLADQLRNNVIDYREEIIRMHDLIEGD